MLSNGLKTLRLESNSNTLFKNTKIESWILTIFKYNPIAKADGQYKSPRRRLLKTKKQRGANSLLRRRLTFST